VDEQDAEEVERYIDQIERLLGRPLTPGRGPAVSLRTTMNTVHCLYRSLLWYFVSRNSIF
jgi:hypothetical protein